MTEQSVSGPLRFEVLGPVRASRDGRQIDLGPAKQRAVLAVLLLSPGRPVPTHRIVDAVWGDDPPENGTNVVQKYVAGLRRALEPDRSPRTPGEMLTLTDGGYLLQAGALDAEDFRNGLARADAERRAGHLEEAARVARVALDLWHGEALGGLNGPVFDSARTRLVEERASAWELWAEIELSRGGFAGLVSELSRLVQEFPLREALRAQLMIALHRSGRQAEALAVFRDAREYLLDELGVEPGERLQETHRRILRNEPMPADPPPAPVSPGPVGVQPYSPQPYPYPAPLPGIPLAPRRTGVPWAEVILAGLIPIVTCAVGSWVYFAYATFQRRSLREAVPLVCYLTVWATVIFLYAVDPSPLESEFTSPSEDAALMLQLLLIPISAVHGAILAALPGDSRRARAQRHMARQFALINPAGARQAGIGRPDLLRTFDDGGLVDLNHAPGPELARLPGISPIEAHHIVLDRYQRGPFTSPEELAQRGLLPAKTVRRLTPWLVCVPPEQVSL